MVTIELPGSVSGTEKEQLQQLNAYLHRTAQQLQWAFDTLQTGEGTGQTQARAPAPQVQPPQAVFAGIKNLIIKSADIVEAYSREIENRLEGVYTARSEFGTFREETAQNFRRDSQQLQQLFESHQTLSGTVDALYDRALDTQAYVKTGLIAQDDQGRPVYGLELGQKNLVDGREVFDRFARFTANRLSFFDSAQVEVAYISDYRLCITNAEVSGSLTLGGNFRVFSGQGLIFQWTGGKENG